MILGLLTFFGNHEIVVRRETSRKVMEVERLSYGWIWTIKTMTEENRLCGISWDLRIHT